jgi:uncharacterized membrane protein
MKKISLALVLISTIASAREISLSIAVDKKISIELSLALEQMQLFASMKTTGPELEYVSTTIKTIDNTLHDVDISEALFLQKSEFYKQYLKLNTSTETSERKKTIELAEKIKTSGMKDYSPFTRWFVHGIIEDLQILQQEKNPNQKKLQILIPWLTSFINEERNQFEEKIYLNSKKYLENLINILALYKTLNNLDTKTSSIDLLHFQTKKIQIPNDSRELTDIIDSSIEQLTRPSQTTTTKDKKTLPIPVDDWVFDF